MSLGYWEAGMVQHEIRPAPHCSYGGEGTLLLPLLQLGRVAGARVTLRLKPNNALGTCTL